MIEEFSAVELSDYFHLLLTRRWYSPAPGRDLPVTGRVFWHYPSDQIRIVADQ